MVWTSYYFHLSWGAILVVIIISSAGKKLCVIQGRHQPAAVAASGKKVSRELRHSNSQEEGIPD